MKKNELLILGVCLVGLQACAAYNPYTGLHIQKVPYVSAMGSKETGEEYVSHEYVSALEEAQREDEMAQDERVKSFVVTPGQRDYEPKTKSFVSEHSSLNYNPSPQVYHDLSKLWGVPADSVGEGVTILDHDIRKRLNDALGTTPVDGEARWNSGRENFVFLPNSEIYQPYHSGGNCRDGVFIAYNSRQEDRVRGLFCQRGRGADWYLISR